MLWWDQLVEVADSMPVAKMEDDGNKSGVIEAVLSLFAAADEACAGVGAPYTPEDYEGDAEGLRFQQEADVLLVPVGRRGSSLCRRIAVGEAVVLPKLHTPQCGVTLRSLSHHLAYISTREVVPYWRRVSGFDARTSDAGSSAHGLNLLLLPWPEEILPRYFEPSALAPSDRGTHRRFDFSPQARAGRIERMRAVIERAKDMLGRVDGVVMPELAVESQEAAVALADEWLRINRDGVFITGVGETGSGGGFGSNGAEVHTRVGTHTAQVFRQEKHHRWILDRAQIEQYGLGGRLNPAESWWENTGIRRRGLQFLTVRPWLTMSVLICEDLARQEPVAELVRAVGPNLVVALLMDGPQLNGRWPARYATVLADDPGSSVLTLTSIGMARLSRPNGTGFREWSRCGKSLAKFRSKSPCLKTRPGWFYR